MTEVAQLNRDIEALRQSLRNEWRDLDRLDLTAREREGIQRNIKWCAHELNGFFFRLEREASDDDDPLFDQLEVHG